MSRSIVMALALVAALVVAPQHADAQSSQTREGFFIGFGLGGGSFGCADCGDRQSGISGQLNLGGALSDQLLLGVLSSGWTKEEGGARLTHGNVSAMLQYYPSLTSGLYLRGGVGLSTLEVSTSGGGLTFSGSESGLGVSAGLGYDFRTGSNFSVSPYGVFQWGDFDGGSANTIQIGLGVQWH